MAGPGELGTFDSHTLGCSAKPPHSLRGPKERNNTNQSILESNGGELQRSRLPWSA